MNGEETVVIEEVDLWVLLALALQAHELDITLNEHMVNIIRAQLDKVDEV